MLNEELPPEYGVLDFAFIKGSTGDQKQIFLKKVFKKL